MTKLQECSTKAQASERDRMKVGRKKRLLRELRLAREMEELVSSVTVSENLRKWERRRRNNRCDVLELLVVVPKITERAWLWDMVAGDPMCEQTDWKLQKLADQEACREFLERNRLEALVSMPDPASGGELSKVKIAEVSPSAKAARQRAVELVIITMEDASKKHGAT